jgi:hypothetical protein
LPKKKLTNIIKTDDGNLRKGIVESHQDATLLGRGFGFCLSRFGLDGLTLALAAATT